MNRFRSVIVAADFASILAVAFFVSAIPANAKQCSAERPANARTYWSYRLIDGRKCWYEGKPMLSKSLLHWPASRTAQASLRPEPAIVPANLYNLLDAQASVSDDSEPRSKPQARAGMVNAGPAPKDTLTPDDLRAWGNSMAAMTAEPIMTILDRWPEAELPQHRTKPAPVEQPSSISFRTIMMVTIVFMALLAVLMTAYTRAGGARRGWVQLLGQ